MKGFRAKTPGERDGAYDPRLQAQMWLDYFREARQLGRHWEGCRACPPERRDPTAILQVHHVVSQQRLKRWCKEEGLDPLATLEVLTDARNSMLLCEVCHAGHTSGLQPLPRQAIPQYAWRFASEKELLPELAEEYPRR